VEDGPGPGVDLHLPINGLIPSDLRVPDNRRREYDGRDDDANASELAVHVASPNRLVKMPLIPRRAACSCVTPVYRRKLFGRRKGGATIEKTVVSAEGSAFGLARGSAAKNSMR